MFGIDQLCNVSPDPNSLEEQLQPYVDKVQRELDALRIQQALAFFDALTNDETANVPVQDESRVDLSHPKNWHQAIDLIGHLADLGDRVEANKISQVLARALDAHPEIHGLTGASWCLALLNMVERAVLAAPSMPSPPKN